MAENRNNGFSESLGDSHFVLVGRSTPKYLENPGVASKVIRSIEVSAMGVSAAVQDSAKDWGNKGLAGFDSIFSPYTNAPSHSELPHFEIPTNTGDPNSVTLDPFNPNGIFQAASGQAFNNVLFYENGHNHQLANTWDNVGVWSTGDINFAKDLHDNSAFTFQGVQSIGFRGPMVLSGWGFDIDGKPVPADITDPDIFANGAFNDPNTWKTGPVDLRWDDERKVWTSADRGVLRHGIVRKVCDEDCNIYEVEIVERSFSEDCDTGTGSP